MPVLMEIQCLPVLMEIQRLPVSIKIECLPEMSLQLVPSILQIKKMLYMPFAIQLGERTDYLFNNNELDI